MANTRKITKKLILSQGLVEIWFNTSGLILGIRWNGRLNTVYVKKINNPYIHALKIAFDLSSESLVKKLTVNGIIGKTHGVNKAIKPPKIPSKNIPQRDVSSFFSPQPPTGFSKSMVGIIYLLLTENLESSSFNEFLFFF